MNLMLFKNLGFSGIEPESNVGSFVKFLESDLTKDNVLVICSGSMAYEERIIEYMIDFNKS